MSTLLLVLFGLLKLCVMDSIPDCDWAFLGGEYIALNVCHEYFKKDEFNSNHNQPSSYIIECNPRIGLQYAYFEHSSHCEQPTRVVQVDALTSEDVFDCSHIETAYCPLGSYVKYRTYDCLPNSTANNHNRSYDYEDYNLITNTCLFNKQSQTSQYIQCTSDSYQILTYHGTICEDQYLVQNGVEMIENNDCVKVLECYEEIQTTSFFTTLPPQPPHNCKFINYDGTGHRMDTCHQNSIDSEMYSYKFHCNKHNDSVNISYYMNTDKCDHNRNDLLLFSMTIPDENVLDFQCNTENSENASCNPSDYMQLKIYESDAKCSTENMKTFDTAIMNEYTIHDIILNYCLENTDGKYCIYECQNNENQQQNGQFTVKYFDNQWCAGEPLQINQTNDIDCYNEKLTQMIFCNGTNNVSSNTNETIDSIVDCNYFVDEWIGRPLNVCGNEVIDGDNYSYKYQCNASNTGIDKYRYKQDGCAQHNFETIEPQSHIEEFHCTSRYSCYDSNSMLVANHYTQFSCADRSESSYSTEYMLVNQCWPNEYGSFSKVNCDERSYTITLYTRADCDQETRFKAQQYSIDDICLFIDMQYREIVYCPNWNNTTWSPPLPPAVTPSPSSADESKNVSLLDCRWVNFNGNARRIDVCNPAPEGVYKWSYRYECKVDGSGVIQKWWKGTYDCDANDTAQIITRDLTSQITEYNCNSDFVCNDYVQLITYDSPDCQTENDYFVTSDFIIDQCFVDDYNESKLLKCSPSGGGGYIIYGYHGRECEDEDLWLRTEVPNRICQPRTQRVEVVQQCTAYTSNVTTPTPQTTDASRGANFTDCNYFYTGLFGIPLDTCQVYRNGNTTTSIMYHCNDARKKVMQTIYDGSACDTELQIHSDETPYSLFHCEDNNTEKQCEVVQMKQYYNRYDNVSCQIDEQYWSLGSLIINTCFPNYERNQSSIVLCNGDSYILHRYHNLYCSEPSWASITYQNGECVDGNIFTIQSGCLICNGYWISIYGYAFPMNFCYKQQSDHHIYQSYKFTCNQAFDGVHKIDYINNECDETEQETSIGKIDSEHISDIQITQTDLSSELLTLRIYTHTGDECDITNENEWSEDVIIVNKCIPFAESQSKMVICERTRFTIYSYQDPYCDHIIAEIVTNHGSCDENGDKTEIMSCTALDSIDSVMPTPTPLKTTRSGKPTRAKPDIDVPIYAESVNISKQCNNFFGGGDVNGTDCQIIEALVWLIIAIGVVSFGCCCTYFFCNTTARTYCLYGTAKDVDDSSEDSYEESMDHPHVMINPNGNPNVSNSELSDDEHEVEEDLMDLISSFNPTGPSNQSNPSNPSNPSIVKSMGNQSKSNPSQIIPAHYIGQTIEIDHIPIDILNGMDYNHEMRMDNIPGLMGRHNPGHQSVSVDVHDIVSHYIRNPSYFADNDTKTEQNKIKREISDTTMAPTFSQGAVTSALAHSVGDNDELTKDESNQREIFERERVSQSEDDDIMDITELIQSQKGPILSNSNYNNQIYSQSHAQKLRGHNINNSLIDPLMTTPMSRGDLVHSEDDHEQKQQINDDFIKEGNDENQQNGIVHDL